MSVIIIDNERLTVVAKTDKLDKAEYIAELEVPKAHDFLITASDPFSLRVYRPDELRLMYCNISREDDLPPGSYDEVKLRTLVGDLIRNLPYDTRSLDDLKLALGREPTPPSTKPVKVDEEGKLAKKRQPRSTTSGEIPKRPKEGTKTARVWEICDMCNGDRAAILEMGQGEGINTSTVQVQYSKWKKAQGAEA